LVGSLTRVDGLIRLAKIGVEDRFRLGASALAKDDDEKNQNPS
jgi:hypothetical protein